MNRISAYIFTPLLLAGAFLLPNRALGADWPGDAGAEIGSNLSVGYEPSGAVWHKTLEHLFIVGDDGDITEMTSDGTIIHTWSPGGDFEGVAVADDSSDYIYIGVEHPDSIYEVDISSWPWSYSGRSWDLTAWMTGADNAGLEALTFVPNGDHAYADSSSGGVFYAGLQADGKVYIFDVDFSESGTVLYMGNFAPLTGTTDISGLDYQEETQTLYSIFDSSNILVETEADGTAIASYDLPGNDQEGVALQPACPNTSTTIYIAEDVGPEVWKHGSYPINDGNCPVEEPDPEPEPEPEPDPDPQPEPDDPDPEPEDADEEYEYAVTVNGKYLSICKNGTRIKHRKIFKRKQDKVRAKIYDYYEDGRQEVVVASLLGKRLKIKTYRLTLGDKLNWRKTKKLFFAKKKKVLKLNVKPNKHRFITNVGKKEFKWKIKRKAKFLRVY
ncbi:MAG: hypothetical protein ABIG66_01855 [Candidatus Kerfeldbacteria bacterium]